jgi:glyoxylase-like metal-dependent hydrolase (beta-lactamase superfamily II)
MADIIDFPVASPPRTEAFCEDHQPDAVFVGDLVEAVLAGADGDFDMCRVIVGEMIKGLEARELQARADRILGPRHGPGAAA